MRSIKFYKKKYSKRPSFSSFCSFAFKLLSTFFWIHLQRIKKWINFVKHIKVKKSSWEFYHYLYVRAQSHPEIHFLCLKKKIIKKSIKQRNAFISFIMHFPNWHVILVPMLYILTDKIISYVSTSMFLFSVIVRVSLF